MWKKLIANKILEKFQDLTIGMKNVIYSYYLSLLPGKEGLHKRIYFSIMEELVKVERKELAFDKE